MHFRPFSVKKKYPIFPIFFRSRRFLNPTGSKIGTRVQKSWGISPDTPRVPIVVFYKKNKEKIHKQIGFPMPTPKNGFQILNLHPNIHVFKKNTLFLMYFCLSFTEILDELL